MSHLLRAVDISKVKPQQRFLMAGLHMFASDFHLLQSRQIQAVTADRQLIYKVSAIRLWKTRHCVPSVFNLFSIFSPHVQKQQRLDGIAAAKAANLLNLFPTLKRLRDLALCTDTSTWQWRINSPIDGLHRWECLPAKRQEHSRHFQGIHDRSTTSPHIIDNW